MKTSASLFLLPLAMLAAEPAVSRRPLAEPPPVTIPEVQANTPALPRPEQFQRTPQFAERAPIVAPARRLGGEFAYARVINESVDFEVVRELPPGSGGLDQLRVPLFVRSDVEAEKCLKESALSLEWGNQTIREFEEVSAPVHKPTPDGMMVYWFTPRSVIAARYADTPNENRRVRLSYRQPLFRGRVVYASSWPSHEFSKDGRPWHRELLVRSLRANMLGRVSPGVDHERLADSVLIFLKDESYVEVVAAPVAKPAQP